jgi:lysozyme
MTTQQDIAGVERAIRHLIGEEAALKSKLKRLQARLKLEQARLRAGQPKPGSHFCDVSSYQPNVNYRAMKAGGWGDMAVTKLTEGAYYVDQHGQQRLHDMAAAGIKIRGGYHFLHPAVSGKVQAQHFLQHGGHVLVKGDRAICDLEISDGQKPGLIQACAREFAQEVARNSPATLVLYGGGPFLHEQGVQLAPFVEHWLAAYVADWRRYAIYGASTRFWQSSDGTWGPSPHSAPGVGRCDISVVLK